MANNTFYGVGALASITTGDFDSAFGFGAMGLATSALNCTSMGNLSMNGNISGINSLAAGDSALFTASNPIEITALGAQSLYSLDGGLRDVAISFQALFSLTTGSDCISIGHQSQYTNSVNSRNISLGTRSLFSCVEDDNISIGFESMYLATLATGSVSIGNNSLRNNQNGSQNVSIGFGSLEGCISGSSCVSVGGNCLTSNNVNNSTGLGYQAGFTNSTGLRLTALGYQAALSVNADDMTAAGFETLKLATGAGNTGFGASAGASFANLVNCSFFGAGADAGVDNLTNASAIGQGAIVSANDALVLGNNANIGIGTSAPFEKLEVHGGAIHHRGLTSGFSGCFRKDLQSSVQTTDETPTIIAEHSVSAGHMITLKGTISGFQGDKTDAFAADFFVSAWKATSGDVQMLDPYMTVVHSSGATGTGLTLEVDVDTSSLNIKVTGIASQTWNWFTDYSLTAIEDNT